MKPLSCAPVAAALMACGTVSVRVPVMKPAEINMAPYQSVAIGGMTGNGDRPMTESLEEALVNSQKFQVVDRQHMDKVMKELQLSSTDLADPNAASKLGKVITAGAMIFGDVTQNFREFPSEEHYQDDKKVNHVLYIIKGEFYLRTTFKIVDVATGRLIIAKTYEEKRDDTNRAVDRRPQPIDRIGLERSARATIVDRFMKAIVPHQEFMQANFQKDGDIPQLEGGIGWAERGDWPKAQATFNDAVGAAEKNVKLKSGQVAKCYWNLGLSYEYAGIYDKASDMINKAYTLSNDKDMLNELDNIKQLQADAARLSEQTGSGNVGAK
ncbi:MAG TPA: CsgG/HfaB family protein [Myxococcales bacterium]|nr:CsgG/HfaB family protein [Myxococcales bacterium]